MFSWLDPVNNWDATALLDLIVKFGLRVYDAFGNLVAFFGTPIRHWFGDKWPEILDKFPNLSDGLLSVLVRYFTGDDSFSVANLSIWDLITTAVALVVLYTLIKWLIGIITG